MPRTRLPADLLILLAASASGACARAPQADPLPTTGAQLVRVEELPPVSAAGSGATFSDACARRLRDPATGREYLIVHSEVRTATADTGRTRSTTLQSAVGDYAFLGVTDQAHPPVVQLRVDCATSRVIERR